MNQARKRPGPEEQSKVILGAAISLFSQRGCNAVSVSEICKKARVSRDTFYRCFTDKDSLVSHLYQTTVNDHIEAVFGEWELDYANRHWLSNVFDKTVDAILEQHQVAQFLFVESADPGSHAYVVIHKAYERVVRRLQRWCRDNNRVVTTREYLMALLVATQWLVHNAIINGLKSRDIRRAKEAAAQLFYSALAQTQD